MRLERIRTTERLRLEPTAPHHADDLFRLHQYPEVAEWHGGVWTPEHAQAKADEWAAGWRGGGVHKWLAYDRVSDELVGRGGASRMYVDGADRVEIGWTIRPELWGRGYATEIGRAAVALAFDELDAAEIVAFTEVLNLRSRAVMERLGMSYSREVEIEDAVCALYTLVRS
jgi:ribosomal-protein-alanine N-acetyltransferase